MSEKSASREVALSGCLPMATTSSDYVSVHLKLST